MYCMDNSLFSDPHDISDSDTFEKTAKNILYLKSEASVCVRLSVPRSQRALTLYTQRQSDRLRCCDRYIRYIRCQRLLSVKRLNSRLSMYIALQPLGVRDDSWLSETSLTATARGGAVLECGLWLVCAALLRLTPPATIALSRLWLVHIKSTYTQKMQLSI